MKPFVALLSLVAFSMQMGMAESSVKTIRVPNGGIQPQAVTGAKGELYLVYFSGDAAHGDLFYVQSRDGGETFSRPIRVNSRPGSAIAAGNIRGARIAAGRNGRIHVVWNGSDHGEAPMLYANLDRSRAAFSPQRDLIRGQSRGVDGGGAVAADRAGNLWVFWHAARPGEDGEASRRVWLARSSDDGDTFGPGHVAFDESTGVCGCCGMSAFADSHGSLFALFRSATSTVHRDMYLLASHDGGRSFTGADISPWNVGACVMSSETFAEGRAGVWAAWETEKQIVYGRIDAKESPLQAPGTGDNRKYPALAIDRSGAMLLAWTEGMSWKKGGSVAWQVLNPSGKPVGETGHADGVPPWSLPAAFARPDGSFRVLY